MRLLLVLAVLGAAALSACASPAAGGGAASPSSGGGDGDAAARELVVEIDRGNGEPAERYTLVCGDVAGGDHPDAAAACDHLAGLTEPFAPIPDDAVCTEQYGGPQTARITGAWDGEPVDLAVSRVNGCAISQWDSLGPLLPGPVGVDPPG